MGVKAKTRVAGYQYEIFKRENLLQMEKVLDKAIKNGIVTQWDTDWTTIVWFNGWPCAAMRELKKRVLSLIDGY